MLPVELLSTVVVLHLEKLVQLARLQLRLWQRVALLAIRGLLVRSKAVVVHVDAQEFALAVRINH